MVTEMTSWLYLQSPFRCSSTIRCSNLQSCRSHLFGRVSKATVLLFCYSNIPHLLLIYYSFITHLLLILSLICSGHRLSEGFSFSEDTSGAGRSLRRTLRDPSPRISIYVPNGRSKHLRTKKRIELVSEAPWTGRIWSRWLTRAVVTAAWLPSCGTEAACWTLWFSYVYPYASWKAKRKARPTRTTLTRVYGREALCAVLPPSAVRAIHYVEIQKRK
jgi:hypothetical protein